MAPGEDADAAADFGALLQQAMAFHRQGKLADAEALYRRLLAVNPAHFDLLHLLGVVHRNKGEPAAAVEWIRRAIAVDPGIAVAHSNLGNALADCKRTEEALASFDNALLLSPDHAEAWYNRGTLLLDLGRFDDALASFDRALALKLDYADALNNRGNVLKRLGHPQEALASYGQALRLEPAHAEAWNNRGNALRVLKRQDEALASFDNALALKPDFADAWRNRGNVLFDAKRLHQSLDSYDRALSLRPDFAEALIARGNVLMELGRVPEALIHYERALLLAPESAEALYQRGSALFQLKRFEAAAASFARLLELSPDHDYAAGGMFHARLHACQWGEYGATAAELAAAVERGEKCEVPFSFLAHNANPATQLECARLYTADKFPPAKDPIWTGERYRHDRIRVAYLSADFHDHATAYLMAGLFEAHDRARFEISAISFGPDPPGPMRGRLRPAFDRFLEVRETSERETARLLRELEIDIAVDLKGYTTDARPGILAQRGAPVQVSYLGYPGTLGADYIDYILADAYVIPAGHERFYSEKIVRLPGSYQVNDRKRAIAGQTPSRAELGLPRDGFVFCCFNNSYKIAPGVFDVWMRLLGQVPGSVLWLLEDNADATRNLVQEADRRGVAADRLVFAPRFGLPEHLARHRQAGLFLDTFPYNAHTTASDALWAGLPLVTCSGETFASRVAGSLLHAAGVPELATDNFVDYEALALKLAMEPDTLAAVRAKLARRRDACPLFDTGLFCRHLEAAYAAMHERHRRDEPPASFDVPPFDS